MEILVIIGLLVLLIILFVFGGLSGHVLDLLGKTISFLTDGCMNWIGCLIIGIVLFLILCLMVI